MGYVKWQDIIAQTNQGLEIIKKFYPDAEHALSRRDKKFKVRDEKTASASIRLHDGEYKVTDFGGDQRERNAIGICMIEMSYTFKEACDFLAKEFNIASEDGSWNAHKPEISRRPIASGETPGEFQVVPKDFTEQELRVLGPAVRAEHCLDFQLHSLKSFDYVKDTEVVIKESTQHYPIFAFINEDWSKLYEPLSHDKSFRFRFLGKKPKKFIYGLGLLKREFEKNKRRVAEMEIDDENRDSDPRVDHVFIVSGGSDGINLRSFGYLPVWYNSESEKMSYEDYRLFKKYAKEIVYIPDLDRTGLKAAIEIGLGFLDVKILMLPDWLKRFNDRRGNPRKDLKDFVEHGYKPDRPKKFANSLGKLIDNAIPCKFWEESFQNKRRIYHIKWTQLYNFLKLQGFGRYKDEHTKDGFQFIRVEDNIVRSVRAVEIEAFVHQFLKDRQMPVGLRDKVYSIAFSDRQLSKMDQIDVDFNIADRAVQYLFFSNEVWEINQEAVERKRKGEVDRYVWENKVLDKRVHLDKSHFKIDKDPHGNWEIDILKTDNVYFNYLINTSRIHWREELEDSFKGKKQTQKDDYFKKHQFDIAGPNLDEEKQYEQKLHLINKIYALGYMLHSYKSPQRPWAVYAMDNKVADLSESHGGSGKSVFLKSIQQILKNNHYINGRDSKKTQDDFIYHGITDETDFTLVDDCHAYMDYGFFFNAITGDLDVNNKQGLRYIIPFDRSPKIGFASNYTPKNLDPSLERRLLFVVFSDYYHYNKDGEYEQTRTISDDFDGRTLFKDFDEREWNDFYNFCAQAIQFFLSQREKIDPPMGNVTKRNLLSEMGEPFKNWADVFFQTTDMGDQKAYLDKHFARLPAFDDYKAKTGRKNTTPQRFKKAVKAYCQLMSWTLNPKEAGTDSNGRIVKKRGGDTIEMFYIQSTEGKAPSTELMEQEDKEWKEFLGDQSDLRKDL